MVSACFTALGRVCLAHFISIYKALSVGFDVEMKLLVFFVADTALGKLGFGLLVAAATVGMGRLLEGIVLLVHSLCLGVVAGFTFGNLLPWHIRCLLAVCSLAMVAFLPFALGMWHC